MPELVSFPLWESTRNEVVPGVPAHRLYLILGAAMLLLLLDCIANGNRQSFLRYTADLFHIFGGTFNRAAGISLWSLRQAAGQIFGLWWTDVAGSIL